MIDWSSSSEGRAAEKGGTASTSHARLSEWRPATIPARGANLCSANYLPTLDELLNGSVTRASICDLPSPFWFRVSNPRLCHCLFRVYPPPVDIPGFRERLVHALPSLSEHPCSPGGNPLASHPRARGLPAVSSSRRRAQRRSDRRPNDCFGRARGGDDGCNACSSSSDRTRSC